MKKLVSFLIFFSILLASTSQSIDVHFKLDQIGYRPNDRKVCVIASPQVGYNSPDTYVPGSNLELKKKSDNSTVFSASPSLWKSGTTHTQSGDKVWWFDFSSFIIPGNYYVMDATNNKRSYEFTIGNNIYNEALKHAVRFFYYQRCGVSKTSAYAGSDYTDVACHINTLQDQHCRDVTQPNNTTLEKNLSGGWHDAGDYNKYTNFTFATVHYLLDAYEQNPLVFKDNYGIPESGNGIPDILDEVKYELDWLLKMQNSDGSVLMKVSTLGFTSGSPPSTDTPQRLYGPAASSATRTLSSLLAHAHIIFKNFPTYSSFSNTLLVKSELAWTWLQNNPGNSNYNNSGFGSANPEVSSYRQNATSLTAAIYLFAATGKTTYRTYVDNNYNLQPIQWTYWYPFESAFQDALLYYCNTTGATPSVVNAIKNNCTSSITSNNIDLLTAYNNLTDAYMAHMQENDYVWGNNQFKCETGSIFYNMLQYNLDIPNQAKYLQAAAAYIHYLHGLNPNGIAFLTNSSVFGVDNPIKEIYHGWFGDGTIFDGSANPFIGAPPAFISCGVNKNYFPDATYSGPAIIPPQNQPIQKCYKDWNTGWPENSWEISEVGIYVNAAYVKLLSKFADTTAILTSENENNTLLNPILLYPNPTTNILSIIFPNEKMLPVQLNIFNSLGQLMLQKQIIETNTTIEISDLPSGVYFCRFVSGEYVKTKMITILE